mmetsp:Transcript_72693/g.229734  ORF Transcript_72693/g.229734 Transcript_72693/m.229734 type:complete len:246 (+) Transcript_72693:219-956(+)
MARASRAQLHREATMSFEALGLFHSHAGSDVCAAWEEFEYSRDLIQAQDIPTAGGAVEQPGCDARLCSHRQHDRLLHRHIHVGDASRTLQLGHRALDYDRDHLHPDLHGGVRVQVGRVRRGRPVQAALPDDAPELLRYVGHSAVLFGRGSQVSGHNPYCDIRTACSGAVHPPRPYLQAGALRVRHAAHGRGHPPLDAGHISAGLPALYGCRAVLQRPLPRRTVKLPHAGGIERPRFAGVRSGVRR